MLEIALLGRPPARRTATGDVPDLGQVPELDPRVMTAGLEPVITGVDGDRVERDQQVRPPGHPGGQPPGPVAAGRPVTPGGGEGEPRPQAGAGSAGLILAAGRVVAAGRIMQAGRIVRGGRVVSGGAGVVFGCGPGAAVADGVALLVGDGDAVRGLGVGGGGRGEVAGQRWVDGAQAGHLGGPFGQVQQGD